MKQKIIIDTDLSLGEFRRDVDDGLALCFALNSPELDVVAVSAVYGNTSLSHVLRNLTIFKTQYLQKQSSDDRKFPPILVGAASKKDFKRIMLLSGISKMADLIRQSPNEITLVPIGPLTNIAHLFHHYPDTLPLVKQLVIMGGKLNGWEFNFANDPAATDFILRLPIPKIICGLEVCTAQRFTNYHYNILRQRHTPMARFLLKALHSWLILNKALCHNPSTGGFFPFDPTAIAYLINPHLFRTVSIPAMHVIPSHLDTLLWKPGLKTYVDQKKSYQKINKKYWPRWALSIKSKEFMNLLVPRLY